MQVQSFQKNNDGADLSFSKLEAELTSFVKTEAMQKGLENKPSNSIELNAGVLQKVQTSIQEAIYTIHEKIKPRAAAHIVSELKASAQQAITPLLAQKREAEHEKSLHAQTKNQCTPNLALSKARKRVTIAEIIIGITEACLFYEALRIFGLSKLPAVITSIGIGTAIIFGLHIMGRWIKQADNKRQTIIRTSLVLIPALIGFISLGMIRSNAYAQAQEVSLSQNPSTDVHTTSGLALGIISFLIFAVGLLFSIRFAKSKAEEQKDEAYQNALQKEKEVEKKIKSLDSQIQAIQNDCNQRCKESYTSFEQAYNAEQKLKCLSDKLVAEFITTNLRYRTNGIPECLANPPQLTFKTFFDNLKNNAQ